MLILFPEHNDASTDMTAGGIAKSAVHEAAREAARIAMDKLADHVGIKTSSAGQEQKGAWQKPKDWAYMQKSGESSETFLRRGRHTRRTKQGAWPSSRWSTPNS